MNEITKTTITTIATIIFCIMMITVGYYIKTAYQIINLLY